MLFDRRASCYWCREAKEPTGDSLIEHAEGMCYRREHGEGPSQGRSVATRNRLRPELNSRGVCRPSLLRSTTHLPGPRTAHQSNLGTRSLSQPASACYRAFIVKKASYRLVVSQIGGRRSPAWAGAQILLCQSVERSRKATVPR